MQLRKEKNEESSVQFQRTRSHKVLDAGMVKAFEIICIGTVLKGRIRTK